MKNKIQAFFKSKFISALLVVSGGSVIAQILNFAFQPIISRLYSVEEFGEYAVYASILTIASVVVSLAYDQAIVSAKDNDEAQQLMFGTVSASTLMLKLPVLTPLRSRTPQPTLSLATPSTSMKRLMRAVNLT